MAKSHLNPYRKIIEESLNPDVIHGEDIDLERGQKSIRDYQKATNDPIGTIDLMLHYVECGTEFATTYSYGDEEFYENLDEIFSQAVKLIKQNGRETIEKFLPRLKAIVHEAEDIGWGYGDGINDTFELAFPDES